MKKWSFDPQNLAEGVFGTKAHFFMSYTFFWAAVQAGEELVKWGKILSVHPFVSSFVRPSPPLSWPSEAYSWPSNPLQQPPAGPQTPQLALRPLQLALRPLQLALRPFKLALRPLQLGL